MRVSRILGIIVLVAMLVGLVIGTACSSPDDGFGVPRDMDMESVGGSRANAQFSGWGDKIKVFRVEPYGGGRYYYAVSNGPYVINEGESGNIEFTFVPKNRLAEDLPLNGDMADNRVIIYVESGMSVRIIFYRYKPTSTFEGLGIKIEYTSYDESSQERRQNSGIVRGEVRWIPYGIREKCFHLGTTVG